MEKITPEKLTEATEKLQSLMAKSDKLDFANKEIKREEVCALSAIIVAQEFPKVNRLILRNSGIQDNQVGTLVAALNYDEYIKHLDLSENDLTQRAVYHLLMCLTSFNETLEELSLANNTNICSTGVRYLAEIVENNSSLVSLTLNGVDLERRAHVLANGLKKNNTLKVLNLQSTGLYTLATHAFISALVEEDSSIKLEELNLNYNPIESGQFEVYMPLFSNDKFKTLKVLHLSFNQLMFNKNKFSLVVSRGVADNTTLKEIYLQGNLFNEKDCRNFSEILQSKKTGIEKLDLSENCININGARSLFFDLTTNLKIKNFDLSENKFQQEKGGLEIEENILKHLAKNRGEDLNQSQDNSELRGKKIKRDSPPEYNSKTGRRKRRSSKFTRFSRRSFVDINEDYQIKQEGVAVLEVDEKMKQRLLSLSTKFPKTLRKIKRQRKDKKYKKNIISRNKLKKNQQLNKLNKLSPLSESFMDQKMISKGLARSATLVSTIEEVEKLQSYSLFLPGELIDELTNTQHLLPGVGLMEMFVRGLKILNTVSWAMLQSLTGYGVANKKTCRKILKSFAKNTAGEDDSSEFKSGIGLVEKLVFQVADSIILMKPVFAFAEALYLVMTSESAAQPTLEFYERRDAKLESRAQKHIHKRLKKIAIQNKKENLKKVLLRAKEKLQKEAEGSQKSKASVEPKKKKKKQGALTKAVRGLKIAKKVELKKKAALSVAPSRSVKTRNNEVPDEVLRFRENCPERVDDVIDDLQSENQVFVDVLGFDNFLKTILSFIDNKKLTNHMKQRVMELSKVFPSWFEDLKTQFKSEELSNLLPVIIEDVTKCLTQMSKAPAATKAEPKKKLMEGAPKASSTASQSRFNGLVARFGGMRNSNNFVKTANPTKVDEDLVSQVVLGLSSKEDLEELQETVKQVNKENPEVDQIVNLLQTISSEVCNETMSKVTVNLKSQFE